MKYIKKYNESQNTLIHDGLKEFCQENLISLIDELEDYSKEYEEITKDAPIKIGNVLITVENKL